MLKFSKTLCLLRNNTKPLLKWFLVATYFSYDSKQLKAGGGFAGTTQLGKDHPCGTSGNAQYSGIRVVRLYRSKNTFD